MKTKFAELMFNASVMMNEQPNLRYGQALYNCLVDINPQLVTSINNTEIDPFYDNNKVPAFLTFITDKL